MRDFCDLDEPLQHSRSGMDILEYYRAWGGELLYVQMPDTYIL